MWVQLNIRTDVCFRRLLEVVSITNYLFVNESMPELIISNILTVFFLREYMIISPPFGLRFASAIYRTILNLRWFVRRNKGNY